MSTESGSVHIYGQLPNQHGLFAYRIRTLFEKAFHLKVTTKIVDGKVCPNNEEIATKFFSIIESFYVHQQIQDLQREVYQLRNKT